jgi:hypothetical protein
MRDGFASSLNAGGTPSHHIDVLGVGIVLAALLRPPEHQTPGSNVGHGLPPLPLLPLLPDSELHRVDVIGVRIALAALLRLPERQTPATNVGHGLLPSATSPTPSRFGLTLLRNAGQVGPYAS